MTNDMSNAGTKRRGRSAADKTVSTPEESPIVEKEAAPKAPKKFSITVHEQAGQSPFVDVGYQGKITRIRRGVKVEVKPEVLSVLEDAIVTTFEPHPENPGEYVPRSSPRIPFTVHGSVA